MTLLEEFESAGVNASLARNGNLRLQARTPISAKLIEEAKNNKAAILAELRGSLDHWLDRVRHATGRDEVFAILVQFRPLPWTDEQRAQMSRTYISTLGLLYEPAEASDGQR